MAHLTTLWEFTPDPGEVSRVFDEMPTKPMGSGPPDLPDSVRRREASMQEPTRSDSLTTQLRELESLQETRVREEEEARVQAAEEARRRQEEVTQRRLEEEEARRRAEEEARMAEEQAHREDEARRLQVEKDAELRVQLQEEAKARAAEQERLHAHEREMTAIQTVEKRKIRNRRILIGGLAFVVIGSAAGYVFGVKPALENKALEAERARQAQQLALEDKERAQEGLVDAQRRAEEAEQATEQFEQKLEQREHRQKEREARQKERLKAGSKQSPRKKKGETCAPDDPLCGLKLD